MYVYILLLILAIWIYLLAELHKMVGKLNAVVTGIFLTVSITTLASNILTIQNALNEAFGGYFGIFLFVAVIALFAFLMLVSIRFITKTLDYTIHKRAKQDITVTLSPKSKKYLGGSLVFDVKFTGWLFAGYFTINARSPYWEEKSIQIRYDDIKKQGHLKGRYGKRKIQLRYNIPNNWGLGKYHITINIDDVCVWPFSLKKVTTMSSQILKVAISESS